MTKYPLNDFSGRHMKPLCFTDSGKLVAFSHGDLILLDDSGVQLSGIHCKYNLWRKIALQSRLASRILRVEPRCGVCLTEDTVLIAWMGHIVIADFAKRTISNVWNSAVGFSTPLTLLRCPTHGMVIWGDYGDNRARNGVSLYSIDSNSVIRTLHTFQAGSIRHVHGVIPRRRGGYYIFTGDMESSSGIYVASDDFKAVWPLAVGEQKYRAVRGFDSKRGLVYATDSASEINNIYLLHEEHPHDLEILSTLNGPCIYGTKCLDGYIFSTTIEPDESVRGIHSIFSRGLGPGVLTREVQVSFISDDLSVSEVARYKGDGYPMKLFQYGSVQFADGQDRSSSIVAFARSLSGYDGTSIELVIGR